MLKCVKGHMIAPYLLEDEYGTQYKVYGKVYLSIYSFDWEKWYYFQLLQHDNFFTIEDLVEV